MLRSAQLALDLLFTISLHCPTGIFIARFYGFLFIYLVSRQYCNILRFIFNFVFCWHMRVVTKKLFVVSSYLLRTVLGHAWKNIGKMQNSLSCTIGIAISCQSVIDLPRSGSELCTLALAIIKTFSLSSHKIRYRCFSRSLVLVPRIS